MAKKARYSEMPGTFLCQTCKEEVYMSRYYQETYECTWLCKKGHLSMVSFFLERGY